MTIKRLVHVSFLSPKYAAGTKAVVMRVMKKGDDRDPDAHFTAPTYRDALSMSVMAIYRQLTLVSNNRPRTTVIIFSNAVLGPQDEARS